MKDFDLLSRGSGKLLRDFDYKLNTFTEYNLDNILSNLSLSHSEFVDLSILCGCDYTSKIGGIGPHTALKLIKKYKNIESIINDYCPLKKTIKIPEDFDYVKARNMMSVPQDEFINFRLNNISNENSISSIVNWFHSKITIKHTILYKMVKNIVLEKQNKSEKRDNTLDKYFIIK